MSAQNTPAAAVELSREEYRSLRATVQQRGTARVAIAVATWIAWASLSLYCWTNGVAPLAGVISLLVLLGGFEVVLALHTGVERIGRYIQVVYETGNADAPAWEHVAMSMGTAWLSPIGLDPIFAVVFLIAILINATIGLAAGTAMEITVTAATHLAFAARIIAAREFVKRQRAHDLAALNQVISSNSLVSKIQQER